MQDLFKGQVPRAAGTVQRSSIELLQAKAESTKYDVIDYLAELQHLIADLESTVSGLDVEQRSPGSDNFSGSWLQTNFIQGVQILKSRLRRFSDLCSLAFKSSVDVEFAKLLRSIRREYLTLKATIRLAYKQKGLMLCATDWQSPVYDCHADISANRLSDGIAEHAWDYKRDGHLDALAYEKQFVSEYAAHLGSASLNAYVTSSGMAAFSTVLHWLAQERRLTGSALALVPMYFENIHLAKSFFSDLLQHQSASGDDLLAKLKKQVPAVVLCDVVTNCATVDAHDIETVITWAKSEARHEVAIVIDSTCFPSLLLPAGLLADLPSNVSVVLLESLAKFHQFGMDTVTGGIMLVHAGEALQSQLRKTRARLGSNIADLSVGSLPKPDRQRLLQRIHHHARNAKRLVQLLGEGLGQPKRAIEGLSCLQEQMPGCPWYQSACLVVHFKQPFQSVRYYREFEEKVVELCKQRGHKVALGTSFGFDVTRLYITAPATTFEEPFLRISVGTETGQEMEQLASIMLVAESQLLAGWQEALSRSLVGGANSNAGGMLTIERSTAGNSWSSRIEKTARAEDLGARNLDRVELSRSVHLGDHALEHYLAPASYAPAPLVELPPDLNPFSEQGVRLFAKVMPLVPLMNIKSLPAYSMLSKAAERGDLDDVENVVESSSSNTVLSLSVMARLFGIEKTSALVDHSIAPSLVRMLRLFGIDVMLHPGAGHELYGKVPLRSQRAADMGGQDGWYNPGQYGNPDNPESFASWLAPDLWMQTQGRLSILSCGLGTCGTMVGVSSGLRKFDPTIAIVGCCPADGQAVPGPREESQLKDVSFDWQQVADQRIKLSASESFAASVKLLRRGIFGGPSSGMNYAGALSYLQSEQESGNLAALVKERGEVWCAFLCCDSPLPHVDEYFDALGEDFFPVVQPFATGQSAT